MKPMKLLCAAALALTAAHTAFAAQTYRNPALGFTVAFPDGWELAVDPAEPGEVVGLGATPVRMLCIVSGNKSEDTVGLSQAQINAVTAQPSTKEEWRKGFLGGRSDVEIIATRAVRHPSGAFSQELEVDMSADPKTPERRMRTLASIIITPGVTFVSVCGSRREDTAVAMPILRVVVNSIRPGAAPIVSSKTPNVSAAVMSLSHTALGQSAGPAITAAVVKIQKLFDAKK